MSGQHSYSVAHSRTNGPSRRRRYVVESGWRPRMRWGEDGWSTGRTRSEPDRKATTVPDQQAATKHRPLMPWERRGRQALTGPWWARALRLDERCAAGRPVAEPIQGDAAHVADIRMERWRTAYSHIAADAQELQTADYGCTPEGLRTLLAEPPERLAGRVGKPAWAADVERVVGTAALDPSPEAGSAAADDWQRGFALILEPFVRESLRLFDARVAATDWSGIVGLESFRDGLRLDVTQRLLRLSMRVFVLELNVLRVTGRLTGDSTRERFQAFVRHHRRADRLAALLDEYAVLARQLILTAGQTADTHAEFLCRFADDRELLARELFDGTDPGILACIRFGGGDAHGHGRSVGIAEFASGRRVVYKPRPISLHRHFNDVLGWFGARLPEAPGLRKLRIVDRGGHGWVEFVEPEPCADAAAANRYFYRQGALLALLHILAGVDFHFENLMAIGDQPVAIDLETIFCVDLPRSRGSALLDSDPALPVYRMSVGRVGLLPSFVVGRDGTAFDAGGMGGDQDAAMPFPVAGWEAAGTDEMRLTRVLPTLGRGHNRPTLDGAVLDAFDYAITLQEGFRAGYRVLAEGSAELTGPRGLLARFADDPVRIIPRPTHDYTVLLAETTHPDALRDALDRDQVFAVLWARSSADEAVLRLARHEVEDLWSGDVPLFTTTPGTRDLTTVYGTHVADVLSESGMSRVERTLAELGDRHMTQQQWIVSAHLATRAPDAEPGSADVAHAADTDTADAAGGEELRRRALAAARGVADRLESSGHDDGRRIGWLGLGFSPNAHWSVHPLGADLYNGYPGVALFLAQLAAVTDECRYADMAHRILRPLAKNAGDQLSRKPARPNDPPEDIGAFTGLTGLALVLASSAALLDDDSLGAPVESILDYVADLVRPEREFDLLSGTAGCLAIAETLAADYGQAAHRLADRCVEHLLAGAMPVGDGVAWPGSSPRPLLGLAHGVAGIAWPLLTYARRTANDEAAAAARDALRYEDGEYDVHMANWPDFRTDIPADQYCWCHGAPGVGLARAALLTEPPSAPNEARYLRRALDAATRFGTHRNHSLCHGELGNLELFAAAAPFDANARDEWRHRASAAVTQIERRGPLCGTPGAIATPGLMIGLSGIGHGLLRIAAPDRIAPVVLLQSR